MYLATLIAQKRVEGGDDLLTGLINAHDEKGQLSGTELVVMAMSLLVAGFETTVSVFGTGVLTLLRHPEQIQMLLEDPSYIEPLVEEILRVNPIGDGGPVRITLEDVEISGVTIPKGSLVIASVSSGNFDEEQFENAETFDTDRADGRHLAFGHGVHFCIGATLARVELRIGILSLFRKFPTLRLAAPVENLKMTGGGLFHRLERLPVYWS
jgi:nocardicin N-oxygenase